MILVAALVPAHVMRCEGDSKEIGIATSPATIGSHPNMKLDAHRYTAATATAATPIRMTTIKIA